MKKSLLMLGFMLSLLLTLSAACNQKPQPPQQKQRDQQQKNNGGGSKQTSLANLSADKLLWSRYNPSYNNFYIDLPLDGRLTFTVTETPQALTITHALAKFHDTSDADSSDLGPAINMRLTFKADINECLVSAIQGRETASLYEPFTYSHVTGLKLELGVEGKGRVFYCFKNKSNTYDGTGLVRDFISEAYSSEIAAQPDYIPSTLQNGITDHILNSLQFTVSPPGKSGQGSTGAGTAFKSGITGKAVVGPTCPVQPANDSTGQCANRPYQGTFNVARSDTFAVVATFQTDSSGMFTVDVPAGSYVIVPAQTEKALPRFRPQAVEVHGAQYAATVLYGDTGIR